MTKPLFSKILFALNSPYAESVSDIALSLVRGRIHWDRNHDYRAATLLAGTGRSGTTWAASIINYDNHYRYLHEPTHPGMMLSIRHFINGQYLRPDNRDPLYLEPMRAILEGRVRGKWVDRYNRNMFPSHRLIKAIRSNLLLRYIRENFPELPIIFMMRHPLDVTHSKLARKWAPRFMEYIEQDELIADHLSPMIDAIRGAQGDFEQHVFSWCIENYVPLRSFTAGEIYLQFYEELRSNPYQEIPRLFNFLGREYDERIFKGLNKPSQTASRNSPRLASDGIKPNWREYFSTREIDRAMEILALFGLERIYTSEAVMPKISARDLIPGSPLLGV